MTSWLFDVRRQDGDLHSSIANFISWYVALQHYVCNVKLNLDLCTDRPFPLICLVHNELHQVIHNLPYAGIDLCTKLMKYGVAITTCSTALREGTPCGCYLHVLDLALFCKMTSGFSLILTPLAQTLCSYWQVVLRIIHALGLWPSVLINKLFHRVSMWCYPLFTDMGT